MRGLNLSCPRENMPNQSAQSNRWDNLFIASFLHCDANYDIRRSAIVREAFLQSVVMSMTLDFHLHIDVMWQRKDFQCLNKFWYFYHVRRYTCLTASVVVYISAPKPSGLDALDPSLPPSNNSQNVVEENSTTQCHLKDGRSILKMERSYLLIFLQRTCWLPISLHLLSTTT